MAIIAIIALAIMILAVLKLIHVINKSRCVDGHHMFEARYSEESIAPSPEQMPSLSGTHAGVIAGIEAFTTKRKTYIHDVCIHCGKSVKAESAGGTP